MHFKLKTSSLNRSLEVNSNKNDKQTKNLDVLNYESV